MHNAISILKTIEWYTLNGWILSYVNCISIKLLAEKINCNGLTKYGTNGDRNKWTNLKDILEVKATAHADKFGVSEKGKC